MPTVAPPTTGDEDERQRAERRAIPITPEEERVVGETLEARLARESPGLTFESPAWGMLRDEYVGKARGPFGEERQAEERAEGREASTKPEVHAPSLEELRKHRLTHLPYRSWCPDCVAGEAVDDAHRRREPVDPSRAPDFNFDDCFFCGTDQEETKRRRWSGRQMSQGFVAHVVPSKGTGAEWVARQLARAGHTEVWMSWPCTH